MFPWETLLTLKNNTIGTSTALTYSGKSITKK